MSRDMKMNRNHVEGARVPGSVLTCLSGYCGGALTRKILEDPPISCVSC